MRVAVVGCSGAGKSTFARALADRAGAPYLELDAVFHQPGWTELPDHEFLAAVDRLTAGPAWVCDGNYATVRPLVLSRATDVVWIDPGRTVVMIQVVWRSVHRAVTRRELWNGNREDWRQWLSPEHPIRWAWSTFDRRRAEYPVRFASPECAHLRVHRLGSRRATRAFLDGVLTA